VYKGYGKHFIVTGEGYKTTYAHLKERVALDGPIKKGDILGYGDSTGNSTGHHLHLTVKEVDANGNVVNRNNGTDGAIDPVPLLTYIMFELRQVGGDENVYFIRDDWKFPDGHIGKAKTLAYNEGAVLVVGSFADIKPIQKAELDAIPDSGLELATIVKK